MLIQVKIIDITKEFLNLDSAIEVDPDATFTHLGIHSALAIPFKHRLEEVFSITLSPTTAFNYPTIRKLAEYIHRGGIHFFTASSVFLYFGRRADCYCWYARLFFQVPKILTVIGLCWQNPRVRSKRKKIFVCRRVA